MSDSERKAAEEYLANRFPSSEFKDAYSYGRVINEHMETFIAGRSSALKELEQVARDSQRWIPVSERLPENSGTYLVRVFDGHCGSSLEYDADHKGWNLNWLTGSREHEMFPTHWMELPQSPTTSQE